MFSGSATWSAGRRSTPGRIADSFVTPTLTATPGDLSLVIPKRILDGIIEMIYALDKIAPGTANDDTLLYGVEVKFYNMEVELDENLETQYPGLYVIGDGSGVTHSLSHASASGYTWRGKSWGGGGGGEGGGGKCSFPFRRKAASGDT